MRLFPFHVHVQGLRSSCVPTCVYAPSHLCVCPVAKHCCRDRLPFISEAGNLTAALREVRGCTPWPHPPRPCQCGFFCLCLRTPLPPSVVGRGAGRDRREAAWRWCQWSLHLSRPPAMHRRFDSLDGCPAAAGHARAPASILGPAGGASSPARQRCPSTTAEEEVEKKGVRGCV